MSVKELDWQGRTIAIISFGSGRYLECDGFNASLRELEVLRLRAMGLEHKEIARKLSIKPQTSKNYLRKLKSRNTKGDEAYLPTTIELILIAEELELLNPYAIKGLKSILEKI